jgi:NADH-quinone oxidoreductase subunit N
MIPDTFNLTLLFPEAVLGLILVLALLGEIASPKPRQTRFSFTTLAALGGVMLAFTALLPLAGRSEAAFDGMFILDPFATFFKALFALSAVAVIQMSREYFAASSAKSSEFYLTLLCTLIGLFVLVSANDFLLLFIALEIVTLSFYILTAYAKRSLMSIEAGLKYLIIGSLASAFMIFGISLLYFAVGSTSFPEIREVFTAIPKNRLLLLGVLMVFAGMGFKMAIVPFQFWVPDVYEGAPIPTVAFLSVASKAAGFAVMMRVFFTVFPALETGRIVLFSMLAFLTIAYGNLGALLQTNTKRLFGYSSIGHAGYLLIGAAVGTPESIAASLFYLITYAVSTLAVFLILTVAGQKLQSDELVAYRGLGKRAPFLAGALFLALLSSAGVPPLAGFSGKFFVLLSAVRADLKLLVLFGTLMVAVSLYYYLNFVRQMYFEESTRTEAIEVSLSSRILILILSAGILLVGIWQAPFMGFAQNAARYLF